jgi:putative ABC transport system permease protein
MKVPDLSLESAYLFGAVMGALMASEGAVSYFAAVGGGAVVGALTGVLSQLCRLPFLLAAIVVNGLFHGIVQLALKGALLSFKPTLAASEWTVLLSIGAVLAVFFYFLLRSQLGYAFAIYGNNPLFFKRYHVSTKYVVICGTILGGAAAGLSGYLFATANGFVDVTMNFGIVLLGITALMLGKVFLDLKQPNLFAPFLGIVLFFVLQHALIKCGFSLKYFNAFQAVMILGIWIFSERSKVRFSTDHLGV